MKSKMKENDFFTKVDLGVRRGVARALAEHKKAGRSIHILRNGEVIEIPAKQIKIDKKLLEK